MLLLFLYESSFFQIHITEVESRKYLPTTLCPKEGKYHVSTFPDDLFQRSASGYA